MRVRPFVPVRLSPGAGGAADGHPVPALPSAGRCVPAVSPRTGMGCVPPALPPAAEGRTGGTSSITAAGAHEASVKPYPFMVLMAGGGRGHGQEGGRCRRSRSGRPAPLLPALSVPRASGWSKS